MKIVARDKKRFEYLPPSNEESDLNDQGEHTGEFYPVYEEPVSYRGSISVPDGSTNQTFYGEDIRYTHVLLMDNPKADIREGGVIRWKGNLYDIVSAKPSMNVLNVALRQQTKDHADGE